MDEEEKFSIDQIKAAFWAEFHRSGEQWFNYRGTDEENAASTEMFWQSFLEHLRKSNG